MVRVLRGVLVVAGLLAKLALGSIAIAAGVGLLAGSPEQNEPERSDDPAWPSTTVVVTVPEGTLAGNVVVVDPSGRELATLTRWYNNDTAVVMGRGADTGVSVFVSGRGSTSLLLSGTARRTRVHAGPDGLTTTSTRDVDCGVQGRVQLPSPHVTGALRRDDL